VLVNDKLWKIMHDVNKISDERIKFLNDPTAYLRSREVYLPEELEMEINHRVSKLKLSKIIGYMNPVTDPVMLNIIDATSDNSSKMAADDDLLIN
jgi:hypothetical protein